MTDFLFERGKRLEDAFFQKRDAELIARQKELTRMQHTKAALAEVSGISNAEILNRLVQLDIEPQVLASLAVIPLVEVAWADGEMHDEERRAIHDAAAALDTGKNKLDTALLDAWLTHKPPKKLLEAWMHYVAGLCEVLSPAQRDELRHGLMDRARQVAKAAGGFLGVGKISPDEQRLLDRMERAFGASTKPPAAG